MWLSGINGKTTKGVRRNISIRHGVQFSDIKKY